jgi:hypothetical protein
MQPTEEALNTLEAPKTISLDTPVAPLFSPEFDFSPPVSETEEAKLAPSPSAVPSGANGLTWPVSPYLMMPGNLFTGGSPAVTGNTQSGVGANTGAPAGTSTDTPGAPGRTPVVGAVIPEPFSTGFFLIGAIALLIPGLYRGFKR